MTAGVVERADHAGDVAQRRTLAPPVDERPSRLAFKIDDKEVVLHREDLAEMEITMVTCLLGLDLVRDEHTNLAENSIPIGDQAIGEFSSRARAI